MSFTKNPPKEYTPWRPNSDFTKFFHDLKKRKVVGNQTDPLVRISNRPPLQQSSEAAPCPKASVKHNYSTPSEILVNTARDLTGSIKAGTCKKMGRKRKSTGQPRRKSPHQGIKKKRKAAVSTRKNKTSSASKLERRLREARL